MRLKGHIVAKHVGEDLVGCPTAPGMKKPIRHVRPESRNGIKRGLMILPQPEMFHKEFRTPRLSEKIQICEHLIMAKIG